MASITVAEDDDDIRFVTVAALTRAGHEVVAARNGAEALTMIRDRRPDLVVSDIDMPMMSGVELARALRSEPGTHDLPILLVSGSIAAGDNRPAEAQATGFLRKPFQLAALRTSIAVLLERGHRPGQEPYELPLSEPDQISA